jgi:hypothetical protein
VSDLGYRSLDAKLLDAKQSWLQYLGSAGAFESSKGAAEGPYDGAPVSAGSDAPVEGVWRPHSARVGDLGSSTSDSEAAPLPALRPQEWTIFAARVQAAPTSYVRLHEVHAVLGPATSASFSVGQLCEAAAQSPGSACGEASGALARTPEHVEAPPHIICGAPATGLASGLVGRDTPFGCHPIPSRPTEGAAKEGESAALSSALPAVDDQAPTGERLLPLHLRAGAPFSMLKFCPCTMQFAYVTI